MTDFFAFRKEKRRVDIMKTTEIQVLKLKEVK